MTANQDIELYMMGEFDGDRAALEQAIADDPALAALAAREAQLELLLRDAAAAATFCPACNDLVGDQRCDACGAAALPGGYVVERVLVSNAHGRMYVAHDADGKQVALKELAFVQSPTLEVIAAFEREAKLLRALEHPAIPRFVASFEEGRGVHTRYYLAQELVSGVALDARLDDHFYSEAEIVDIARQVLDVLVYLQGLSPMVIHRDIKPANMLLKGDGKVAVVDFGAAHVHGTTGGSTSIGTFGYMPIEQLAGQVDATTDPYALGASLLHLLSRREPWRILQGVSLEGINVSPQLRGFLGKLVAPEPKDRFPNAAAAKAALERVSRGELVVARARRWWRPLAVAAASLALVASGVGVHALVSGDSGSIADGKFGGAGYGSFTSDPGMAMLRIEIDREAELRVDDESIATVHRGSELPLPAGQRRIQILTTDGQSCAQELMLPPGKTTTVTCVLAPDRKSDGKHGMLRVEIPDGMTARLSVDGKDYPSVRRGGGAELPAGRHKIQLVAPGGQSCEQTVTMSPGTVTTVACALEADLGLDLSKPAHVDDEHPNGKFRRDQCQNCHQPVMKFVPMKRSQPAANEQPIPPGAHIDVDFKWAALHDVLRTLGEQCGLNLVVPDSVDARITVRLKDAPCDQALEVLLESHGLWYRYDKGGNIVRVAPRVELDREAMFAVERANRGVTDDQLPAGEAIDLDMKNVPLPDLLQLLTASAKVNIVLPDAVQGGRITLRLKRASWDASLRAILASQGLWYRYRPNGKLLRIAPRVELDREAAR